jgi:hypothetical protein
VVKEVERASIVDTDFYFDKGSSTAYDVGPAADFDKEYALHKVGRRVFELKGLFLDHFLKFEPIFFLAVDNQYSL